MQVIFFSLAIFFYLLYNGATYPSTLIFLYHIYFFYFHKVVFCTYSTQIPQEFSSSAMMMLGFKLSSSSVSFFKNFGEIPPNGTNPLVSSSVGFFHNVDYCLKILLASFSGD